MIFRAELLTAIKKLPDTFFGSAPEIQKPPEPKKWFAQFLGWISMRYAK